MPEIYIPLDREIQDQWFSFAGINRPIDEKAVKICLFGIAYMSINHII